MGTITQYPVFVAELEGGRGCWEREIEEEREEGERKSERVPQKGDGRKRLRRVRRKK